MALQGNNVQNVKFLRNQTPFASRTLALDALETNKSLAIDGSALLARYSGGTVGESDFFVKTLVAFVAENGNDKYLTIFDVDGASADVEALREQMNNTFGTGVTTANTATAQLAALSGNSQSSSAETSVEGAKRYAEDLIGTLDGGVTAETGYYVKSVSEVDGKISGTTEALPSMPDAAVAGEYVSQVTQTNGAIAVTRVELPSSADTAEAKKVVIAVAENKGQIEVSRGSITSSGKTIVLTDNADGGVNFEANVDGTTIIIDENTGTMSVASSALVQYEGDDDTIQIGAVSEGKRIVSSPLTIQKVTTGLSEIVKEEYHLIGASGNTIGAPVQIYKDSHIVSITYITDTGDTHYQNLEYVYIDASGNTQTTYVDMSELVIEAEFASGVTVTDGVAHGVVDPQSELDSEDTAFLTVGASGFKISGIKDEIDRQLDAVVENLDATVTGETANQHISISIEELDGKLVQSGLTITESNIANADDLAELSAKTVTEIASSNSSISATSSSTADGTVKYDVVTDANKIKMSGFTADTSGFTAITEASTITEAVKAIETKIIANEQTVSTALNDLRTDIDTVSGDVETISGKVDTIETNYVSGVSVNGNAVTVANHVAPISVEGATSAMTPTSTEAIVVDTDTTTGAITLGLGTIDCGTY